MKSRYAEKVKPSGKIYSKTDRRENRVTADLPAESLQEEKNKFAYQGGCLCGAVRFSISGKLRHVINCHCGQCLHTHGHYAAYTSVDKKEFQLVNDGGLKWFRSSNEARRGFCQECGASLFFERLGGCKISIAAGMLDSSKGLKTVEHIFVADKPDYYEIEDDLQKFSQYYNR
ncbi:MAG: GFA family protein [SAR324 cluster bacterium]|nr:GFA family protein [SAR324 cluster bacterium]MBL7034476.1 GFA family protein [SAR324 cluster bacterium]